MGATKPVPFESLRLGMHGLALLAGRVVSGSPPLLWPSSHHHRGFYTTGQGTVIALPSARSPRGSAAPRAGCAVSLSLDHTVPCP